MGGLITGNTLVGRVDPSPGLRAIACAVTADVLEEVVGFMCAGWHSVGLGAGAGLVERKARFPAHLSMWSRRTWAGIGPPEGTIGFPVLIG